MKKDPKRKIEGEKLTNHWATEFTDVPSSKSERVKKQLIVSKGATQLVPITRSGVEILIGNSPVGSW